MRRRYATVSIVPTIRRAWKFKFVIATFLAVASVAALVTVPLPPTRPAAAAPGGETDDEGGTAKLRAALDAAGKGYSAAAKTLKASQARQQRIVGQMQALQKRVNTLTKDVDMIARGAYTGTGFTSASAMNSVLVDGNAQDYLSKMTTITMMSQKANKQLTALASAKNTLTQQRSALSGEILRQQQQVKAMAKRKADATAALRAAGGGEYVDGPGGNGRAARSGPRGSSCSISDPTGGSCVTATMLHAYKEARAAGFTRYTHCQRPASFGEHGKGRACDFSASKEGFGGVASGDEKEYGDSLSAWFIKNSDALDVMYVIWYRKIWMPGSGWQSYSSGGGDPSSDHTNHVHLSVN